MTVSIREAVPRDADRIRDVHLASIRHLGQENYTDRQVRAWAHDRDPDEYPIESDATYFVVAEATEEIVGFGWLKPDADAYLESDVEGEITATYVAPSVARRGIGSRIYAALEKEAIRQDISSLGLWASLTAVPFYEHHGYEQVTKHRHEYAKGVSITVVEMVKRQVG